MTSLARKRKLSDHVAATIGGRIIDGHLQPGERVPTETDLCNEFGVSRTVVRDALRTLSALGMVDVLQGSGTVVTPADTLPFGEAVAVLFARRGVAIGEIIDARCAIEIGMAGLVVARAEDPDIAAVSECFKRFEEAVASRSWDEAYETHSAFHKAIVRSLHSPVLEMWLEPIEDIILLSAVPPRVDDASLWEVEYHAAIVEALQERNESQLRSAVADHYEIMGGSAYADLRSTPFRERFDVSRMLGRPDGGQGDNQRGEAIAARLLLQRREDGDD